MLKEIEHIAVVVKDIDAAVKIYADMFGFTVTEKLDGPEGEFKAVKVSKGDITFEFIQPLKPDSRFTGFLEEGGGLHHVALVTDDIEQELRALKAQGKELVHEEPISLPSAKIAFIHQNAAENVSIELVQKS